MISNTKKGDFGNFNLLFAFIKNFFYLCTNKKHNHEIYHHRYHSNHSFLYIHSAASCHSLTALRTISNHGRLQAKSVRLRRQPTVRRLPRRQTLSHRLLRNMVRTMSRHITHHRKTRQRIQRQNQRLQSRRRQRKRTRTTLLRSQHTPTTLHPNERTNTGHSGRAPRSIPPRSYRKGTSALTKTISPVTGCRKRTLAACSISRSPALPYSASPTIGASKPLACAA